MQVKQLIVLATLIISIFEWPGILQADRQAVQAPQFKNLGSFHHGISTKIPLAQRYFDQGLVLFYGFEWGESIRSFKEATRLDPNCGMCYWGLALALGNKMNAPMTGHEYSDAQYAIQKALLLKSFETPEEQDYVKALSLRYKHAPKLSTEVGVFSCHASSSKHDASTSKELIAYSNAMKKITEKYPTDNVAKSIFAYALFNRIDWKFWDSNGKINPLTPLMINLLKSILANAQSDIGGNHYYVHVIEQSPRPEDALVSADQLTTLVPGSEHLVHMPSHIYFLTGHYQQGIEANLRAIEAFQQYNKTCYAQGFDPEINYLYFHNYDFLRSIAAMGGRKKLALSAAKQIIDKPFSSWLASEPTLQGFIPIPYFVEARFGMWKELLKEPMPETTYQYALGMWHYAEGMALVNTGDIKEAEQHSLKLQHIMTSATTDSKLGESGGKLLTIAHEVLLATLADRQGNENATLKHLKSAKKIQHAMGYHEPPDWYFPMKEILADAYLKWGHPKEAIALYHQDLEQYPQNGWALYGLAKALRKVGENQKADRVEREFKTVWKYSDISTPFVLFDENKKRNNAT
ncbi:MAG: tetratricopeptide repeat protein [Gammaproteobacteria bacterium]